MKGVASLVLAVQAALAIGAALPCQTVTEQAQALLASVEQLANDPRPAATEVQRRQLLERADAVCDAAAAAGGDVFLLRWQLAKHAYAAGAWVAAVALYDDCVAAYGDDAVGALEAKRLAGECRSILQQTLPFAERDFGPALRLLGEVAATRAGLLEQALAKGGSDPLPELEAAVEAIRSLGVTLLNAGQRDRAREQLERAHALLSQYVRRLAGPDIIRTVSSDLQDVLDQAAMDPVLDATTRLIADAFPEAQVLMLDLGSDQAIMKWNRGDVQGALRRAREIRDAAVALDSRRPEVLHLLGTIARILLFAQQPSEALPVLERGQQVLDHLRLSARNADAKYLTSQRAEVLWQLGKRDEAFALLDAILDESPESAGIWQRRGRLRYADGDLEGALADSMHALAHLPAGAARYQCLANIARIHARAGRSSLALAGLEALLEEVRRRPGLNNQYDVGAALADLGHARYSLGDFTGAQPLLAEALDLIQARTGPDSVETQRARINLGACLFFLGRLPEYEALQRAVRDSLSHAGLTTHVHFAGATVNLAEALAAQGRWQEARALAVEGGVVARAVRSELFSGLALAIEGVADLGAGEPASAAGKLRDGIAQMAASRAGADNQDEIAWLRSKLLLALAQLDDAAELRREVLMILRGTKERLDTLTTLSSRERGEVMAGLQVQAEQVVALHLHRPGALDATDLFELLATLRAVGGPIEVARRSSGAQKARIDDLRHEALVLRRRVAALARNAVPGSETHGERLAEAITARDAAERALLEALPAGSKFTWITAKDLAPQLHRLKAMAVAIHRIRALPPHLPDDHFLAFTVDGSAALQVHDLGPSRPIEQAVADWRRSVTGSDRGTGRPVDEGPDAATLGTRLRKLVLDPVLHGGRAERLFLCLDDVLNTVPWEALPLDGAQLIGDRHRLASLPSLRDLLDAARRPQAQPSLLAFGDLDYDARGDAPFGVEGADRPAQVVGQPLGRWQALAWSEDEIGKIGKHFSATFRRQPKLATRGAGTKAALFAGAPSATWLHVATHGYFAAESLPARGDVAADLGIPTRGGFAPLTLCGLVLAGGNNQVGSLDEVPGIVTAEELAGLDLAACRLAVLSGCETGLGSRRAGQGLASLQAALHAAGAGNTVASLWRVPDKQTADLMARFYELMWLRKLPPDEALWQAKGELRKAGRPLVSWAGWVFSGVPENR